MYKQMHCLKCGEYKCACTCPEDRLSELYQERKQATKRLFNIDRDIMQLEEQLHHRKPPFQELDIHEIIHMRPLGDSGIWELKYHDNEHRQCATFFRRA